MSPTDIVTYARAGYNATADTFFSDSELYYLIYQAELEMANECNIVEAIYTTTTTAGTRQYSFPSQTRIIKRIEYIDASGAASKLEPITFREDDSITGLNTANTTEGTPQFYSIYNFSLYLRPTPDTTSNTIKVYSYNEPEVVTQTSTLDVPTAFHMDIVDFLLMKMALKDSNPTLAQLYHKRWDRALIRVKRWVQKRKRGDAFTVVQDEDSLAVTLTGPV